MNYDNHPLSDIQNELKFLSQLVGQNKSIDDLNLDSQLLNDIRESMVKINDLMIKAEVLTDDAADDFSRKNHNYDNSFSNNVVEILLQQNTLLESEVNKLVTELDDATKGILKRGYLYKWRDREMSYASKWGLRFFELKGCHLSYYEDDNDNRRPRRTIDLTNCIIRNEGIKKSGQFHVFGIYLPDNDICERGPTGAVLMRLSSENPAEAEQWIHMLQQATEITNKLEEIKIKSTIILKDKSMTSKTQSCTALATSDTFMTSIQSNHTEFNAIKQDLRTSLKIESASQTLHRSMSRRMLRSTISQHDFSPVTDSSADDRSSHSPGLKVSTPAYPHPSEQMSSSLLNAPTTSPHSHKKAKRKQFNAAAYPASKPIHMKTMPSPLSSDVRPGEQNYRGFFHLGLIIFVLSHFRLISDNMVKYGLLLHIPIPYLLSNTTDPARSSLPADDDRDSPQILAASLSWVVTITLPFTIELLAASPRFQSIPDITIVLANTIVGIINIVVPIIWVWTCRSHPLVCMLYLFESVILWMKLISYVHVNRDLRLAVRLLKQADRMASISDKLDTDNTKSGSPPSPTKTIHTSIVTGDSNAKPTNMPTGFDIQNMEPPFLQYPQNLTILNLLYFCLIPTLCYQLNYPRSPSIRWNYLLTILIRLGFVSILIVFVIEQYMVPTLAQSVQPMQERNVLGLLLRLIKLSIPNTYAWLLGFYLFFHLWMNLLAELTRFGDRLFYKDWWNARTIDIYWRSWNLPVHHWMLRHLYYPLLRAGASKRQAVFVVFFFSAAFHEIIISTPFRRVSLHAFFGMLAQAPLIYVTKQLDKVFDNALLGNCTFWLLFCVFGQPMGIIMYYFDIWKDAQATANN